MQETVHCMQGEIVISDVKSA